MNPTPVDAIYASLTDSESELLLEAYNRLVFWWGYAGEKAQLALDIDRLIDLSLIQELSYNAWGVTDLGALWLEANGYTDDITSKLVLSLIFFDEGDAPVVITDDWKLFSDDLDDDDDFDGALPMAVRS